MPSSTARSSSPRRTRLTIFAVGLALGLLAVSCGSSGSGGRASSSGSIASAGTPVNGGSLVVGIPSETGGWNPHYNQIGQVGSLEDSAVLEPLVTIDANLNPIPWLATAWTPNATFTSYVLTLRQGVTFQDGEAFDATAAKMNIDDSLTGPVSGTAFKGLISHVAIINAHSVKVDLSQPWAAFPDSFLTSAWMMAPAMMKSSDHGSGHPIGTGPFTFASWQPGSQFSTTKNPTYWQKGLPHLNALAFKVLTDASTQTAALQAGDVNMLFTDTAGPPNTLQSDYKVLKDWNSEPGMVLTNTLATVGGKPNPASNQHARLALAYATNRSALAALAGAGVQSPNSPFPPTSKWGLPEAQNGYVSFDLTKAKQEVSEYEQETGQSSLKITLSSASDVDTLKEAQLLQSQWKDAGITTSLNTGDVVSFSTGVVFGHYQVALFSIYSAPDPDEDHYFWSAETANGEGQVSINFTQYSNPQIQADLKIGRQNPNFTARKAAYDDLVHQINAAAINIWTYATPYSLIANKKVQGLEQPSKVPFGNFQPKTWLGDLWLSQ